MRTKRENGIALITALLILFLVSAIVVGMSWMVMSDQRLGGNNSDRETAFYGAEAGMEKMTADMGNIFSTQGSVTAANIPTITGAPPVIQGVTYVNAAGASTYQIGCPAFPCVAPVPANDTIQPPSSYAGMQALITSFTMQVAAQTTNGAEVKLQRQIQLVAIPVFQFGIFSNTDLSYFNGPPFNFGGRVHTNGNLWLSANSGPLYLANRVTAVGQVIRTNLENGFPITAGGDYSGSVSIALTPNPAALPAGPPYTNAQWRELGLLEGSVSGTSVYGAVSTTLNNPTWNNTVIPAYNGMLQSGVQPLNLVATALGGLSSPVALIRRPVAGELLSNPAQFAQRYFANINEASLRILLDDYGPGGTCANSDMMSLDTVSATAPVDLKTLANIPISGATTGNYSAATGYWQSVNTPTITGCIKIEYLNAAGAATDVTAEILGLGYLGKNINPQGGTGPGGTTPPLLTPNLLALPATYTAIGSQVPLNTPCPEISPNAVIRIARLRDNPSGWLSTNHCGTSANGKDYWPMVLYDTREGVPRPESAPGAGNGQLTAIGAMYYIELDVANLAKWFKGTIGASGVNANSVGGYEVYFSDRRGNIADNITGVKVGSLGYNDFVNPGSANACPNGGMDSGEDIEGDGFLRTYGSTAMPLASPLGGIVPNLQANNLCPGAPGLWQLFKVAQEARENPDMYFRRALKLVNGSTINLGTTCYGPAPNPPCGLTIASENPVYIQGDYNAPGGNLNGAGTIAASVAGDTVTLLSDNWNDVNSFITPYAIVDTGGNPCCRVATQTSYRVALIAGKGIPFPQPAGEPEDFGTDGGLHNFLRFLENWGGVNGYYEGSLVSFYYNRQGVGLYKTNNEVYSPPNRFYNFDSLFSQGPQWLPPRTPTLRAINTIGFSQMLMPTQ